MAGSQVGYVGAHNGDMLMALVQHRVQRMLHACP
jgi:hypothetical protein